MYAFIYIHFAHLQYAFSSLVAAKAYDNMNLILDFQVLVLFL